MKLQLQAAVLAALPLSSLAQADNLAKAYVTDSSSDAVFYLQDLDGDGTYNGVGEVVEFYSDTLGTITLGNNSSVTIDTAGVVYVSDSTEDIVLALEDMNGDGNANGAGEHWVFFDGTGASQSGIVMTSAQRLVATPDGRIWVASANSSSGIDEVLWLEDMNADGDANDLGEAGSYFAPTTNGSTGDSIPADVQIGQDGNVYYLENGSTGWHSKGVYRLVDGDMNGVIDPVTEVFPFFLPPAQSSTAFHWGFHQAADGSWYMADTGNEMIWRFRDDDADGQIAVGTESSAYWTSGSSSTIWEVEAFEDGSLYCAESQSPDRVLRMVDGNSDGSIDPVTEVVAVYDSEVSPVDIVNPRGLVLIEGSAQVGVAYCFCDAGAAPCGNPGDAESGCANGSSANGAKLGGAGVANVANDSLVLQASGVAPSQPGLYFQGDTILAGGSGVLFGDGLRCAGGSVIRLETVFADASGNSQTSVSIAQAGGVSAGDTRHYQLWYRDPVGSPCGSFFNLTNGFSVSW